MEIIPLNKNTYKSNEPCKVECGATFCKISWAFLFSYNRKLKKYENVTRYHCQDLLQHLLAPAVTDITSLKLHQC